MKQTSPTASRSVDPARAEDPEAVARSVRAMFAQIAHRYDFLNHLLSFSVDKLWRRRTARHLAPILCHKDARVIDLCCGTGDLTLELARHTAGFVIGSDFCHPMLEIGARKATGSRNTALVESDALALPFADAAFGLVTAAFGFRNLADYRKGLAEMHRILPRVGRHVSGVAGPYDYLPNSVESFPDQRQLAELMQQAGFDEVSYQNWTGGIVALHTGVKAKAG